MKNFNKQIKITVELDTIAQNLLSTMREDEKHRELIVEAIIGKMESTNDTLGMTLLYNALNGFTNTVNFKEGEKVICTSEVYGHWEEEQKPTYRAIGEAKVIEVNEYANNKVKVEYYIPQGDGSLTKSSSWVSHTQCSKVPVETPIEELAD